MTKAADELRARYDAELAPILADIQAALKAATKKALRLFLILLPVAAVVCIRIPELSTGFAVGLAVAVATVPTLIYYSCCRRKQTVLFKDIIVRKVLAIVAPEMDYDRKKHIPLQQFQKSGIYVTHPDRYSGEDYFFGKYNGVDLTFSEIHAQRRVQTRDSKGRTHTHYVTIFKGVFFIADFNKDFRTSTLVIPTSAERVFGGTIGRWIKKLDFHKGTLIKLESPEFEKMFAVYAQDAIEARYILTPNIMERMIAIQRRFPGDVAFAFHASTIYIAIPQKADFFELPRTFDFAGVLTLHDQLALFFDLVHELNLTLRIWTKT